MPSTLLLCMAGYSLSLESLLVQFLPGLPAKGSDGQTVSNFAMIFLTTWVRSIGTVFGCVETIRKVNVCSSLLTFLHQEPVRRIKALHGCGQGKPIMFRYKFYLPDCLRLDCLLDCWVPFPSTRFKRLEGYVCSPILPDRSKSTSFACQDSFGCRIKLETRMSP